MKVIFEDCIYDFKDYEKDDFEDAERFNVVVEERGLDV